MYGVVKMKEMLIRKLVSAFQMIGTTRPMGIMQANVMIGMDFFPPKNANANGICRYLKCNQ